MQMWNMTLLEHLALKNKYKTVDDYGILLHIQMVYPKCCKTETTIIKHYFYIFCELSKIMIQFLLKISVVNGQCSVNHVHGLISKSTWITALGLVSLIIFTRVFNGATVSLQTCGSS